MNRRTLLVSAGAGLAGMGVIRLAQAMAPDSDDGRPLLGMNLTPITYFTPSPFIDRIKTTSGEWTGQGGSPPPVGPTGYPTSMGGASAVFMMVAVEPASPRAPVLYELSYDGEGTFEMGASRTVFSGPGKTVFAYSGTGNMIALIYRSIGKTPPTRMTLIRRDHAKLFAAGEIFTPQFLAQVGGFDTLRFMDWTQVNGSQVTNSMVPVSALTYSKGVPVEIMIALANKTGAKPWVTLPHLGEEALFSDTIAKLKAGLHPDLSPTIEYSNEVWNLSFPQARYAKEQAEKMWGPGTPGHVYYGYRSGQLAKLARGSGARVVLGCQTVVPAAAEYVWKGVGLAGATDRDFSEWIIATYVNGDLTRRDGPTLSLMAANDVQGAIDNILNDTSPKAMSVRTMGAIYAEHGKIAKAHGLRLTAYEGNLHLNAVPAFFPELNQTVAFFTAIANHPDSVKIMRANLDAFEAAGGEMVCLFNLATAPGAGGVFGLVDKPSWAFIRQHLDRSAALTKRT